MKKLHNSFLISLALMVFSNVLFYLFDFRKYGFYVTALALACYMIFLVFCFFFMYNVVNYYKGKQNKKLLTVIFFILFLCSNTVYLLIGEYIGRDMVISLYMLGASLFNFPYYVFENKILRESYRQMDN